VAAELSELSDEGQRGRGRLAASVAGEGRGGGEQGRSKRRVLAANKEHTRKETPLSRFGPRVLFVRRPEDYERARDRQGGGGGGEVR
jgi:hypothetical protein